MGAHPASIVGSCLTASLLVACASGGRAGAGASEDVTRLSAGVLACRNECSHSHGPAWRATSIEARLRSVSTSCQWAWGRRLRHLFVHGGKVEKPAAEEKERWLT